MSKFTGNIIRLPAVTPTQNSASGVYTLDDQFTAQSSGTWPIVRDQYFNYTTLLLTGAVQGTAYPNPVTQPYSFLSDASTNNFVVSPNGDVSARPFNPYLNNYSNYFDGTANGSLRADSTADTNLSGDFTIQAWVFPTASGQSSNSEIISRGAATTLNGWRLGLIASTTQPFFGINYASSGNTSTCTQSSTNIPLNQWTYVAVTRSGNTCRIYINGVLDTTNTGFTGTPTVSGTEYVYVGRGSYDTTNRQFTGYVTNASIIKGTALTTFNQTQPLATGTSGQALLTCTANRFIDTNTATTAKLLTVGSGASVSQNSPFVSYDTTNGSGYFDKNGDYLSITNTSGLAFGTSDFTVEFWLYLTAANSAGTGMGFISGTTGSGNFGMSTDFINIYAFTIGGAGVSFAYVPQVNRWTHYAFVRSSGSGRLYIDGSQVGTAQSYTTNITSLTGSTLIGAENGPTNFFAGYFSSLRYVSGTAVYTGNFTPPTGPLARSGAASAASYPSTTNVNTSFAESATSLLTLQTRAPATNNGFIDSSPNNFVVTRNGNTTQGSFSPFSPTGWGAYFDGSNDNVSFASGSQVIPATGDFTIEAWVYPTSVSAGVYNVIYSQTNGGASAGRTQFVTDGSNIAFQCAGTYLTSSSGTLTANRWNYVAATRTGSSVSLYVNGSATTGLTASGSIDSGTSLTAIGANWSPQYMAGYISNFRVSTTIRSNLTTVPTSPFANDANTRVLTLQNNRFVDNSPNNFTLTANNGVAIQAFSPFAPAQSYIPSQIGGSGYFDGTGDYFSWPSGASVAFGTGDFTVEMWAYQTSIASSYYIDARNASQTNAWAFLNGLNAVGDIGWFNGSSALVYSSVANAPKANQWNHLVYVRSGTTGSIFVNGVRVATATDSTNYTISPTTSYVACRWAVSDFMTGYLSSLRIVKGTAVYDPTQTTITVPTAPLTPVTGTSLLLNFTNGGIVDATGKNNLETVANSGVQTSIINPFGSRTGLMYFNGSSYFYEPYTQLMNQLNGNFTMECWIYPTVTNTRMVLTGSTNSAGNENWFFEITSSNKLSFGFSSGGSTVIATSTASISQNAWTYVAVVRNGGTITQYINGSPDGTASPTGTYKNASYPFAIGRPGDYNSLYFTGYIDEFRMTIGQARTITASPTGPFPLG